MAKVAFNEIVVEELFALGTLSVIIIAAVIANIDVVAVAIDSKGNFISKEVFIALIAEQILVSKTTGANIGAIMDHSHLAFFMIFFAMLAKAIIFVKAMVADLDTLTVTVEDFPSFISIIFALLAQFAVIVFAVFAKEFRRKFAGTGNAKPVSTNVENLEVVSVVLTDRNFSVKVSVRPVRVTAKTVTARNVNAMFIAAIFFGLPEVRDAFEFGKFTLNQIAIKF